MSPPVIFDSREQSEDTKMNCWPTLTMPVKSSRGSLGVEPLQGVQNNSRFQGNDDQASKRPSRRRSRLANNQLRFQVILAAPFPALQHLLQCLRCDCPQALAWVCLWEVDGNKLNAGLHEIGNEGDIAGQAVEFGGNQGGIVDPAEAEGLYPFRTVILLA